jgi:hypothetical protein
MAKRTRYPNRPTRRSGGNAPTKPAVRPTQPALPEPDTELTSYASRGTLTEAELARAAQLESEIVAAERAADSRAAELRAAAQRSAAGPATRRSLPDFSQSLSVRAAHEYAYVGRDVRRIALTAALMFGILAALHVAVNVAGVISL